MISKNKTISNGVDKLAQMSQGEFTAIRGEMAAGFVSVRAEMATKQELAAVHGDLKSAIDSSADRVVDEIKIFMKPHIKSFDTVLVDVEKLKERVKV